MDFITKKRRKKKLMDFSVKYSTAGILKPPFLHNNTGYDL